MRILNFGSLNIDHVYKMREFVRPGETIDALGYEIFPGGKGLNQSIALARAGARVCHAGLIGQDGVFLKNLLEREGADCSFLRVSDSVPTGHAVIQVTRAGENSIILYGGSNQAVSESQIDETLAEFGEGDFLLRQNEISGMPCIMKQAKARNMRIFFNPAPMNESVFACPLETVDFLIVNEIEAAAFAGMSLAEHPEDVLTRLRSKFPSISVVMTLGAEGALYAGPDQPGILRTRAVRAERVVDTTAAGDTYIGYLLAELSLGKSVSDAMATAAKASSVTVSRMGAAVSIPTRADLD